MSVILPGCSNYRVFGAQTPWTSAIDGGGYDLTNVGTFQFGANAKLSSGTDGVLTVANNAGTLSFNITAGASNAATFNGAVRASYFEVSTTTYLGSAQLALASSGIVNFSSTGAYSGAKDVGISRAAANVLKVNNGSTGWGAIEIGELASAPSAPAANGCRVYCVDNGGKTELYALFATGAAQLLGAEP